VYVKNVAPSPVADTSSTNKIGAGAMLEALVQDKSLQEIIIRTVVNLYLQLLIRVYDNVFHEEQDLVGQSLHRDSIRVNASTASRKCPGH